MKFTLEQHMQHLRNIEFSLAGRRRALKAMIEDVARLQLQCFRLRSQISEAERQRKDGFDSERFLKMR